jgi:hypothetical protein
MKNQLTLLVLGLAALVLATDTCFAQPAQPTKPVPPARPVPPVKPAPPVPPDAVESQLAASEAALEKAKMSFKFAEANWGKTFGRLDLGSRTLVIPRDSDDTKDVAETEEDMNVMARILEKAVNKHEDRNAAAMGIAIHGPSAAPQNLYIEGYGALFLLSVNYPLVAPPPEKKEDAESKAETSTEWETTHRELYRPPGSDWDLNGPFAKGVSGPPAEEYDPDKVEALKKNLLSALKNGAHIRALKPDEFITVVVTSRAAPGPKAVSRRATETHSQPAAKAPSGSKTIPSRTLRTPAQMPGTKLIIRAKKADIEAFQEQKIDLEDFRKKVNLMMLEGQ